MIGGEDMDGLDLTSGPTPGWLGAMVALHGRYYAEHWQFPLAFEARVATEAAAFVQRYVDGRDVILSAWDGNGLRATVTLDVSDPALEPGLGHLRWFIADPAAAGRGLGTRLFDEAISRARQVGLGRLYLTTFEGLTRAAQLYARAGFGIVHEADGATWGRVVREQRLERRLDGA